MRSRTITATLVVLLATLCAVPALGQGGHIGLYSDYGWSDCNLNETMWVPNTVYVVHTMAVQATAAQFRVISVWPALFVGVNYGSNLHIGDIFTNMTFSYVGCKALPHLLAVLTFIPFVPSPGCTGMRVIPAMHIPSNEIEVVDCSGQVLYAAGGTLWINEPECCTVGGGCGCSPVAIEETTWSRVKALYR